MTKEMGVFGWSGLSVKSYVKVNAQRLSPKLLIESVAIYGFISSNLVFPVKLLII